MLKLLVHLKKKWDFEPLKKLKEVPELGQVRLGLVRLGLNTLWKKIVFKGKKLKNCLNIKSFKT